MERWWRRRKADPRGLPGPGRLRSRCRAAAPGAAVHPGRRPRRRGHAAPARASADLHGGPELRPGRRPGGAGLARAARNCRRPVRPGRARHVPRSGSARGIPGARPEAGRRNVRAYVRDLQEVLVRTLAAFGVSALGGEERERIGVWVGHRKIASIGIHLRRWVTTHGFALNVSTELDDFAGILSCGFDPGVMTSIEDLTGRRHSLAEVAACCAETFADVFERGWSRSSQLGFENTRGRGRVGRRVVTRMDELVPIGAPPAAAGAARLPRPDWLRIPAVDAGVISPRAPAGGGFEPEHGVRRGALPEHLRVLGPARYRTFMILGDTCTRRCGFCAVHTGRPAPGVDPDEPARVGKAAATMGLRHVVVTSVDRDDLPDGGAGPLRGHHPGDPGAGARQRGRGADAGLSGRRGRPRHRPRGAAGGLLPQHGDGAPALPSGAAPAAATSAASTCCAKRRPAARVEAMAAG